MPLDLERPIIRSIAGNVLEIETNDTRFELYCQDVVSSLEGGAVIFGTSRSWDRGRDGVGAGAAEGIYICVSLRDDIDLKALQDLQRISNTTGRVTRLYFCFNGQLSEHRRDQLKEQLEEEIDRKFPIEVLGISQLLDVSRREPGSLERNYGPEILNSINAIDLAKQPGNAEDGLRLALIASSGENSRQIREELYSGAILDALSGEKGLTVKSCSLKVSNRLRLSRAIPESALLPHLQTLCSDKLVIKESSVYLLTDTGEERIQALEKSAARRFIQGKAQIREAIEGSIGAKLAEDDFRRLWNVVEERIAHHFHTKGVQLVNEVSLLLGYADDQNTEDGPEELSFLKDLSDSVAATAGHPQRGEELKQATIDLFTDGNGPASDWLVKVCASFLSCCTLGLEHTSGGAIRDLLSKTHLLLDSDVMLSLLGLGEPEHESVSILIETLQAMGGKTLVAEPVLEEVAYHAHIAEKDYKQVRHNLPGTREERLHLIDNAFVRSFAELMAAKQARQNQWRHYISQFRGNSPYDWSALNAYLKSEHSIAKLPVRSSSLLVLEDDVASYLFRLAEASGHSDKSTRDKAKRDSRLYADLIDYVRALKQTDPTATCLLVSSARRLAKVELKFKEAGEPQLVIPISSALYLIALAPGVSLGLSSMRAFLFDERRPGYSSTLERDVIRIVKSSSQFLMPWAKRGLLGRKVREALLENAKHEGSDTNNASTRRSLEKEMVKPDNRESTLKIISRSLDRLALDSKSEEEASKLRKENDLLKEEIARLKGR